MVEEVLELLEAVAALALSQVEGWEQAVGHGQHFPCQHWEMVDQHLVHPLEGEVGGFDSS